MTTRATKNASRDVDPYWSTVCRYLDGLREVHGLLEDRSPILLIDVQEERIYAYPYDAFKSELSAKSQASLTEQFGEAGPNGEVVVFVRDNDAKRLVSYSVKLAANRRAGRSKRRT